MTRSKLSWMFLFLLVVANGLWVLATVSSDLGPSNHGRASTHRRGDATEERLRARVAELERELAHAREAVADQRRVSGEAGPPNNGRSAPELPSRDSAKAAMLKWIRSLDQTVDAGQRQATITEIREALTGRDDSLAWAALRAVWKTARTDPSVSSLFPLVIPFVDADSPALRRAALFALAGFGRLDPDMVALGARDQAAEVRIGMCTILRYLTSNGVSSHVESAFLRLLSDPEPKVVRAAVRTVPASAGVSIQERLALLSRDERFRSAALDTMGQLGSKSAVVVAELVHAMADSVGSIRQIARRGFRRGVPSIHHARVAEAALDTLESQPSAGAAADCFTLLARYGNRGHIPRLERVVSTSDDTAARLGAKAIQNMRARR